MNAIKKAKPHANVTATQYNHKPLKKWPTIIWELLFSFAPRRSQRWTRLHNFRYNNCRRLRSRRDVCAFCVSPAQDRSKRLQREPLTPRISMIRKKTINTDGAQQAPKANQGKTKPKHKTRDQNLRSRNRCHMLAKAHRLCSHNKRKRTSSAR